MNTENIIFPPAIKDIEQFEKGNPDEISLTTFEYGGFHKIKEDDNHDDNNKKGIVIEDVRISPYALKRKDLIELMIIQDKEKAHFTAIKSIPILLKGSKHDKGLYYCKKCYCTFQSEEKLYIENIHIPLCTNTENVLTMSEKNKNDILKCRDYHMQAIQLFMSIANFETYTNKLNQIKQYSFAMFTYCIFNENNNKLTKYTGKDCLDEFFNDLTYHVN